MEGLWLRKYGGKAAKMAERDGRGHRCCEQVCGWCLVVLGFIAGQDRTGQDRTGQDRAGNLCNIWQGVKEDCHRCHDVEETLYDQCMKVTTQTKLTACTLCLSWGGGGCTYRKRALMAARREISSEIKGSPCSISSPVLKDMLLVALHI